MKRKLINYDVFERIQKDALSAAEGELKAVSTILEKKLGVDSVKLNSYGDGHVLYETRDGTYIHANYQLKNNSVILENIEQLVVDEETEQTTAKDILSKMIDAVLSEDKVAADSLFNNYLAIPSTKRMFKEAIKGQKRKSDTSDEISNRNSVLEFAIAKGKGLIKEWSALCKNVFDFVNLKENNSVWNSAKVMRDDQGNVVSLEIPTIEAANQKKLITLKYQHMLDTDLIPKRWNGKKYTEDMAFCRAIGDLKRQNAVSDQGALEEVLESIIGNWPDVIYLTQNEMAAIVKEALEIVNASNYDDQTCHFMAEGILRRAFDTYSDKASRIVKCSGEDLAENEDKFEAFQEIAGKFFTKLDEQSKLQMNVYVDLYEALKKVYEITTENMVKAETTNHLNELAAIIRQEVEPSLKIAENAADWLAQLIETNLATQPWAVSNKPHQTVTGDHPAMAEKARKTYSPSGDGGGSDWGDPAPVSDGKSYKNGLADEMRNRGFGNVSSGNETWPELNNPYVPKPFGDYSMKGEMGADKANDATSQWSSGDTWPALQNPYVPHAETPESYQMNHGKETDLVVNQ
jgi:hypothetical protein